MPDLDNVAIYTDMFYNLGKINMHYSYRIKNLNEACREQGFYFERNVLDVPPKILRIKDDVEISLRGLSEDQCEFVLNVCEKLLAEHKPRNRTINP